MSLTAPPGEYIKMTVGDTGCGISAELQDRIFEPYFTTKQKTEGTGLGLDDEAFFLDILTQHLRELSYRVTAAQNSLNGLHIFREAPNGFDLVITDQTMPEMTGLHLISEIRKLKPDVPVILCTGYNETVSEKTVEHYRITKFLMKPVSRGDLAWAVHEILTDENSVPEPTQC